MRLRNMLSSKMGWAFPTGPRNDIALSSRVRLARNLDSHPFPSRSTAPALETVLAAAFKASERCPGLAGGARLRLDSVEPLDRRFLVERHLISNLLAERPDARGVVVAERDLLSMMVNEEDHLRLQGIDSGLCLRELHLGVDALDEELGRELPFAFHERWGYATACPTNAGTGLRASVLVHLPGLALSGQISRVLEALLRLGILARGLYGEGTTVMGDFYQISNATSLGPSEPQIVDNVARVVEGLLEKELEARQSLVAGGRRPRIEDLVYRSLGVLERARLISFEESMQHLSLVRLGLSLNWELPADMKTVNELLVLAQPAHIQMLHGNPLDPADRDFLRATLFRTKFSPGSK